MQATVVNATKIMIVGDFDYFLIVDRIGMTVELIPFLFGAGAGQPADRAARPVRLLAEHLQGAERVGVRRSHRHDLIRELDRPRRRTSPARGLYRWCFSRLR
jgi:hypothetical protein